MKRWLNRCNISVVLGVVSSDIVSLGEDIGFTLWLEVWADRQGANNGNKPRNRLKNIMLYGLCNVCIVVRIYKSSEICIIDNNILT